MPEDILHLIYNTFSDADKEKNKVDTVIILVRVDYPAKGGGGVNKSGPRLHPTVSLISDEHFRPNSSLAIKLCTIHTFINEPVLTVGHGSHLF